MYAEGGATAFVYGHANIGICSGGAKHKVNSIARISVVEKKVVNL